MEGMERLIMNEDNVLDFYNKKRVLITGDTGFKGSWLSKIMCMAGAEVYGFSNGYTESPSLYELIQLENKMTHIQGDVRNLDEVKKAFDIAKPEIVFHLAAQAIVRKSYINPVYTYETNVIGTLNVLECIRLSNTVKSFVNITTDKVYFNDERKEGFKEEDMLNGIEPYSNSKSCSELVTSSYKKSFFKDRKIGISTVRAGNVLGGGDYAKDRIIPDCVRAVKAEKKIHIRTPNSVRPYQHVLDALGAYMLVAKMQYIDASNGGEYNVGPNTDNVVMTNKVVDMFCTKWGNNASWECTKDSGPYESNFLSLNCEKIKKKFNWSPKWNIEKTIDKVVEFEKCDKKDYEKCMEKQIREFFDQSEY